MYKPADISLKNQPATFQRNKYFSNARLITIIVCLLIAASLWFLNALGKTYTTLLQYPVRYISFPQDKVLSNSPPKMIELKVTANGFTLLRHKLIMRYSPVLLNVSDIIFNTKPTTEGYVIRTESFSRNVASQLGSETTLGAINPDYIVFRFDGLENKTVKVIPSIVPTFKNQFNISGPVTVTPERVLLKGPKEIIDTINVVFTQNHTFKRLDKSIKDVISVTAPPLTTLEPDVVRIEIPVEEFTEKEMLVPVSVKNAPGTENIKLFPSSVKVVFMTGLTRFKSITPADFSIVVDYNEIKPGILSLPVSIEKQPDYIQALKHSPESLEFLIERK